MFPSSKQKACTTRSWDFIQMPLSVERNTLRESDVIVGVFDTGTNSFAKQLIFIFINTRIRFNTSIHVLILLL